MSKRKATYRGYSPRKVNTRDVKSRFLIVCEGEKTEPNYFKSFRVPKKVIDVQAYIIDPEGGLSLLGVSPRSRFLVYRSPCQVLRLWVYKHVWVQYK